ncbi:MAG: 3-dehydroquinate synthase [Verrucomicrobiales bacterium]|nr:3-dehydroquinate synthase [Verrucomicrobiales bacterium]
MSSRIERTVTVNWRHQVLFTQNVFDTENATLRDILVDGENREPRKVLLVLDEALAVAQPTLTRQIEAYFKTHEDSLCLVAAPVVMEGGERTKNSYFHVSEVHSQIDRYHIDRHSYLICVGGGALLDMVGLAAATAHRGIRHIRIPTTTLSQDDSGVGVKNGINAFGKKNFIGTFAPPFAVINDFQLLATLSSRDKRNGYVEAVKVACIRDTKFFEQIEKDADGLRSFEPAAMQRLIHRCAELHMNHIATSGDPFEMGSARPLDFGHWAAHKLEQISEYRIRHGEAVAVGIALDCIYAREMGHLWAADCDRILRLLERLGFSLWASDLLHEGEDGKLVVLEGLEEFREHLGGRLTITLLRSIGEGFEVHEMNVPKVLGAIHELQARGHAEEDGKIIPAHG